MNGSDLAQRSIGNPTEDVTLSHNPLTIVRSITWERLHLTVSEIPPYTTICTRREEAESAKFGRNSKHLDDSRKTVRRVTRNVREWGEWAVGATGRFPSECPNLVSGFNLFASETGAE